MILISNPVINSVQTPPQDTPSGLCFNPCHDIIAASAWDCTIRFYSVSALDEKFVLREERPILSTVFNSNGSIAFGAVSDGNILAYDLQANKTFKISAHSGAIKAVKFYNNLLISGSFDKTLKFWDLRTTSPVHTINLSERVFCMDLNRDMLSVSLAGNKVSVYDLRNNCQEKTLTTKLFWQVRSICSGNDNETVIVGGIEGKAEVLTVSPSTKRMMFRCHRTKDDLYSVNMVSMHPSKSNIIASGGSDGFLSFFDRDSRLRIVHEDLGSPVTCGTFNENGSLFAFGIGYDWHKGYTLENYKVDIKILRTDSLKI
eukprot:jgi/Antlo1/2300/2